MTTSLRYLLTTTTLAALVCGATLPQFLFAKEREQAFAESGREVFVPDHAIEKAPGLYYLGETEDAASGEMVEGYMIVHPRSNSAKPDGAGGGNGKNKPGGDTGDSSPTAACYGFIAKGAKWKNVEPLEVDPTNAEGLNHTAVFNTLSNGIDKWEDAADGTMDGNERTIFGSGSINTSGSVAYDDVSTDGRNEVMFGDLDTNTIGVTIVWGIFGGNPNKRVLVEWDQVYNQVDFDWSITASGTPTTMDFESIATHELGHAMGLADLYNGECSAMTMYGYGAEGQIHARTLEDGDVNGMADLY